MFNKTVLTFLFLAVLAELFCQTVSHPNFGLKSHPTLDIESVLTIPGSTTLFMVIENRTLEGTFCADKKIYITQSDGQRLKIKEVKGIPRCPDSHVFKSYGEKLYFSLTFSEISEGIQWFDLTEDCDDACFSFNSVILDAGLNQKIDHAYGLIEAKKLAEACKEFESLLTDLSMKKCNYEGAVYWNLIQITKQMGDEKKSVEWIEMLKKSDNPLKERFIENIN